MGHDGGDPGDGLRFRGVDGLDAAPRDGGLHGVQVERVLLGVFVGVGGQATDLGLAVDALQVLPGGTALLDGHGCSLVSDGPGVPGASPRFSGLPCSVPVPVASSSSTDVAVLQAMGILKALSRSGVACSSSASRAARMFSSVAAAPRSASSARVARQGLWATPPRASRTVAKVGGAPAVPDPPSSSNSMTAATETRAKA